MSRRPSLMTRRSSNQSLLEHFNRMTSKEEFERIRDKWFAACIAENLSLHNNLLLEFNKRIERCAGFGERAKLDFSNCELDDRRLTLLIEALAKKPVVYKIDLSSNNITNEGVKVIRKLLKGQIKLAKDFPIDKRLYASFLAEITLDGNMQITDYKLLDKLNDLLRVLKYCNAQAHIRTVFVSSNAPDELSFPFVMKMWLNIIGKPDRDQISPAFNNARVDEKGVIHYKDLEAVLMQGLMAKGLLLPLTADEILMVTRVEPKGRKNSLDPAAMQDLFPQLRDQPKSSQDVMEGVAEKKAIDNERINKPQRRLKSKDTITEDDEEEEEYVEEITDVDKIMEPFAKMRSRSKDDVKVKQDIVGSVEKQKKPTPVETTEYDDRLETQDVSGLSSLSATPVNHGRKSYGENDNDSVLTSTPSPTKTSMLQDSPAHTARVNTAEVYADQEPFLEDNPMMTDSEDGNPNDSDNLAKYLTNQHLPTPLNPQENQHNFSFRSQNPMNSKAQESEDIPHNTNPRHAVNTEHVGVHAPMGYYEESESDEEESNGGNESDDFSEQHDLPPDSNYMLYPSDEKVASTTVLNLSHKRLTKVKFTKYIEISQFSMIRVLVLRNNEISDVRKLRVFRAFPFLTDLDLGFNLIAGKIEDDIFPRKLQRLDLSYNLITDVSGLMTCIELVELNLCHNHLKNLYGLPTKIERLDISENQLITVSSLRSLTLCFGLQYISIRNNPMNATVPNMKVFLKSLFINLKEFDGIRIGPTKFKRIEDSHDKAKQSHSADHKSKKEQEMNDALRSQIYLTKKKQIEDAKARNEKLLEDEFVSYRKKTLPAEQVQSLAQRLAVPKSVVQKVDTKNQQKEEAKTKKTISPVKRPAGQRTAALFEPTVRPTPHQSMIAKAAVSSSVLQKRNARNASTGPEKGAALQEYRDNLKSEVVKISSVFKLTFGLVGKLVVESKDLASFNSLYDKIKESRILEIPPVVLDLVEGKEYSIVHKEIVREVRRMRDEYEKGTILLQQIQTAVMLSAESGVGLADAVDLLLNSKLGIFVNESILKRFNCDYDYKEFKRQHPKIASPIKTEITHFQSPPRNQKPSAHSPDRKLVPTANSTLTGKSTSSSLNYQPNHQKAQFSGPIANTESKVYVAVPETNNRYHHMPPEPPAEDLANNADDFTYQVIDPTISSSCESSPVTRPAKGIAVDNDPVLENVRNRIAQKLLPPEIAQSMKSKEDVNLRNTTLNEKQLDDGHVFGSMPTLRPVDNNNKRLGDSNVFGSMPQLKHIEITKDSNNGTAFIEAPEELSLKERMKLFSRESAPPKPKILTEVGSRYNLKSPTVSLSSPLGAASASPASQSYFGSTNNSSSLKSPKAQVPTNVTSPPDGLRSPKHSTLQRTLSAETMRSPDHAKKTPSSDNVKSPSLQRHDSSRGLARQESFRALQRTSSSENIKSPSHKSLSRSSSMKNVKSEEELSHSSSSTALSARERLRLRMKKSSESLSTKSQSDDPLGDLPMINEVEVRTQAEDISPAIPENTSENGETSPTPSETSTMSARERLKAKMAAKKISSQDEGESSGSSTIEVEAKQAVGVEELAPVVESHEEVIANSLRIEQGPESPTVPAHEHTEESESLPEDHAEEIVIDDTQHISEQNSDHESAKDDTNSASDQDRPLTEIAMNNEEPEMESTEEASEQPVSTEDMEEKTPVESTTMSARDRLRAKLAKKRDVSNEEEETDAIVENN